MPQETLSVSVICNSNPVSTLFNATSTILKSVNPYTKLTDACVILK